MDIMKSESHLQAGGRRNSPVGFPISQSQSQMTRFGLLRMQHESATNRFLLPPTHQSLRYVAYNAMKGFFLPTVYAQQVLPQDESAETTVERLMTVRPSLIVSEKEVNDFLEMESGRERVKEMFSMK